jgi:hypothetical protein
LAIEAETTLLTLDGELARRLIATCPEVRVRPEV